MSNTVNALRDGTVTALNRPLMIGDTFSIRDGEHLMVTGLSPFDQAFDNTVVRYAPVGDPTRARTATISYIAQVTREWLSTPNSPEPENHPWFIPALGRVMQVGDTFHESDGQDLGRPWVVSMASPRMIIARSTSGGWHYREMILPADTVLSTRTDLKWLTPQTDAELALLPVLTGPQSTSRHTGRIVRHVPTGRHFRVVLEDEYEDLSEYYGDVDGILSPQRRGGELEIRSFDNPSQPEFLPLSELKWKASTSGFEEGILNPRCKWQFLTDSK